MVEPEVAFLDLEGLQSLAEEFVEYLVARALERCQEELKTLERDSVEAREREAPFPRITYREAIELLASKGMDAKFGDDFGGDEETVIANSFDRPVMISRYPTDIKAFYMQPDPNDPDVVLGLDMIAPEGYGEIIGGWQRTTTTTCCSSASSSTTCRSRSSSGTSTSATTAPSRTPASAWASSAASPGSAACRTSARRSRIRAC